MAVGRTVATAERRSVRADGMSPCAHWHCRTMVYVPCLVNPYGALSCCALMHVHVYSMPMSAERVSPQVVVSEKEQLVGRSNMQVWGVHVALRC